MTDDDDELPSNGCTLVSHSRTERLTYLGAFIAVLSLFSAIRALLKAVLLSRARTGLKIRWLCSQLYLLSLSASFWTWIVRNQHADEKLYC